MMTESKNHKIKLHYLIGDVHKGGHDVHRVAKANKKILDAAGAFEVLMVCDDPDIGEMDFDAYITFGEHTTVVSKR